MSPESVVKVDGGALFMALEGYKLNAGSYPSTEQGLKALVKNPAGEPFPKRWVQMMDHEFRDPWGKPYRYSFPGNKNPDFPQISSDGPDGRAGTADDLLIHK